MTNASELILLFSYGTLQLESVQLKTFGRLLHGERDSMPGWKRSMLRITDPDVIAASGADHHPIVAASQDPSDCVEGVVFEITTEELAAADAYEVSNYKRIFVRLASGQDAWVYVQG